MGSLNPPYGYAIRRNGSCVTESEVTCGPTWGGFNACCPHGSVCPQDLSNDVCCPSTQDCTDRIALSPHCANDTWTLFYHDYFCCASGQTGFWTDNPKNAVGCTTGALSDSNYTPLTPITSTSALTSSTQTATTTSTATTSSLFNSIPPSATSTSASNSTNSSSNNHTGAIAGGVVGGVAGIVLILGALWYFFIYRRRQTQQQQQQQQQQQPQQLETQQPPLAHEYFGPPKTPLTELSAGADVSRMKPQPIYELPPAGEH
ncbi:hypothetical protein BGW36DRAFT_429715 [Talaromyces proteolyticus]|uniref:Mid2 domain-containing protein n=1 Tax=Talaromyces proteolyticus TaxID=1131652 RepID=A0AAD4KJC4_9EURO|nr:uncharacterized protein BGW36DRAFT_429715 [Talaromyces proteolyticus]KAH8693676.1 hypothetical protein BGW36DRAFT_429715 [Talaromyces proteolyticus]